ncbi:uncharacterized protein TA04750 [Theileria annulata]|uniref:Threonylcarbamoyl-AMP synthase n=1 Tax=Theileria annulata TaxID=5874 RepID=Q4UBV8_THEAN|nr:uncharacterized protein TA04750 [Theileria annulata]CAI75693.1 hypothetical protein, conserved [Theileria annulata]|eukprot:XP_955169.1 hypothetical protein, conserved [Theileria annulata]
MTLTILRVNLTPEITPNLETKIIFKPKSSNQSSKHSITHSTKHTTTQSTTNTSKSPYPTDINGSDCDVLVGDENEIFEIIKTILMEPGGLIAIPTETVYGLAGNIHLENSLLRIFSIKDRPFNDPLIVHVHSFLYALRHLYDVNDVEAFLILFLAEKFAPGPLTIVARKAQSISPLLTNQTDFIAVRCPNNKVTLKLLEFIQVPLAAPSANKFGHISPTCPEHVKNEFPNEDLYILDDGNCTIGIESTIIKLTSNKSTVDRDRDRVYGDGDRDRNRVRDWDNDSDTDSDGVRDSSTLDRDYGSNKSSRSSIDKYDMLQKLIKSNNTSDYHTDLSTGYRNDLSTGYRNILYSTGGNGNIFDLENFKNCRAEIELLRKGSITLQEITNTLSQFPNIQIKDYTNSSTLSSSNISPKTPSTSNISPNTLSPNSLSPMSLSSNTLNPPTLNPTINNINILSDVGSTLYNKLDIQMPGMFKSHYAPLVPTYIIKKIEIQVKKLELHKGTSKNSTLTGDLTYNLNFDYEEVNCSNIIIIDIGNQFRKYSHLFNLYLPLGSNPIEVANKLYTTLRKAESKAIQSTGTGGVGMGTKGPNGTKGPTTGTIRAGTVTEGKGANSTAMECTMGKGANGTKDSTKSPITSPKGSITITKDMNNINCIRIRNKIIAINFGVDNEKLFSAVYDRILKASAGKIIHLHQVENTIKFLLY